MFKWLRYPFLRFTPVWMVGILTANLFNFSPPLSISLFVFLLFAALVLFIPKKQLFRWHTLIGFFGLLALFLTSCFYTQFRQAERQPQHLVKVQEDFTHYVATVIEPAEARSNSFRSVVEVDYLLEKDSLEAICTFPVEAKVIIYQPKADSLNLLQYGDQVLIEGRPQQLKGPANPHEFDYRKFLANQHIHHQHYKHN